MTAAAAWAHRFNRRRLRITPVERIRSAAEMRTIPFSTDPERGGVPMRWTTAPGDGDTNIWSPWTILLGWTAA